MDFIYHDYGEMSLCTCDLCSLPVFAFVFCITYSWWWHYEWVTRTHCQVWNIAPSISGTSTLEVLTFSFFLIIHVTCVYGFL